MDDDQRYTEILAAINRLEVAFTKNAQNFEDYKENRSWIASELLALKSKMERCNIECDHQKKENRSYFKKTDFLMTWYGRAAAGIFAFQALIAIMVLVGRVVDLQYTVK
ncbi:MAG: hypothetical protein WC124_02000 [Desulfoplanes sp.]